MRRTKVHSVALGLGLTLTGAARGAPPGAPEAASPPSATDGELQQRIELLERQSAVVRARLASVEVLWARLARTSLWADCASLSVAVESAEHALTELADAHDAFARLAAGHPERRDQARRASGVLRASRSTLVDAALPVVRACGRLPQEVSPSTLPRRAPERTKTACGDADVHVDEAAIVLRSDRPEFTSSPTLGLDIARCLSGALESLPGRLVVRVEGLGLASRGLEASFFPGRRGGDWVARGDALESVVVVPLDGPLSATPALHGLVRGALQRGAEGAGCGPAATTAAASRWSEEARFLRPVSLFAVEGGAEDGARPLERVALGLPGTLPGGSSAPPWRSFAGMTCPPAADVGGATPEARALLVVLALRPVSDDQLQTLLDDWRAFRGPAPDREPARLTFFEATGTILTPARPQVRSGGCVTGLPDLP